MRFRGEDVKVFDRMPDFLKGSKPRKADRYKLMRDEDGDWLPPLAEAIEPTETEGVTVLRAAQQGTVVDLAHRRLQTKLHSWLCEKHGKQAVQMESECVELRATLPEGTTFYEIKMTTSAKKCIREALGQLFEFAAYATAAKAKEWVVVGDPSPTK